MALMLRDAALRAAPQHEGDGARRILAKRSQVEEPTCGCKETTPAAFHCFRIVIYNERRNFNVSSRQRAVADAARNGDGAARCARSHRAALAQDVERDAMALDRRRKPAIE